ncbi:MAG: C4-type zinc ribbon domain-containing protein [Verrucomicrobiae bacterium]|nr:C4-type zinc ribbon domain-containing protein [Verrucomicrobiae bacterium]
MKIIERLYELQELELGSSAGTAEVKRRIETIRKQTPEPVMGHYDRLVARGKKAVAIVSHGVCTGCRMRLPSGAYAALLRDDDICMCDNCGRYLLLDPEEQQVQQVRDAEAVPKAQSTSTQPERSARSLPHKKSTRRRKPAAKVA